MKKGKLEAALQDALKAKEIIGKEDKEIEKLLQTVKEKIKLENVLKESTFKEDMVSVNSFFKLTQKNYLKFDIK